MGEAWSYDRKKWIDRKGNRWHFAQYHTWDSDAKYWYLDRTSERNLELYFRNDERTIFGMVKYPRARDCPYTYEKLKEKIMNDVEFRKPFVDPETKRIWKKGWK